MSNQDYLATAFVQVKPRTVGFQAELREQLRKAIEPIKNTTVLVSPSTVGFAGKLRTQVREAIAASGVHTVPITPVLTKFRAQLQKDLNAKPIPITVTPSGKAGAGTGAREAVAAEEQLTAAEQSRKAITDQLRESERLLKEATREGLSLKERDALTTRAQTLAREALTSVTEGQVAGERVLVQEQLRARGLRAEAAAGRAVGGVSDEKARLEAEAKAAADAAAAEKALANVKRGLSQTENKLLVSRLQLNEGIKAGLAPTEELARVSDELIQTQRISRDLQVQEVGAIRDKQKEQAVLIQGTIQDARNTEELLKARKALLQQRITSNAAERTQEDISKNIARALSVEVSSLTSLEAVREVNNALKKESRALDKLEKDATAENAAATKLFVAEKRQEIATRQKLLAEQNANIKGNLKEATSQKNLARGAGATFLSQLGARGATLAAGSEFLAGAAAVSLFIKAVSSAASLEQELNVFRVTARATAEEMARAGEQAKILGADVTLPAVAASDAAEAFTALAKAGLTVEDSLGGARGVLQLATAAQIENAEATELVASALNAFGLAGVDATHVADLLTGAANEAQGTITDMGIALQQSSAVARQAGLSLEDTVAFITLLARAGIRGSDAGTSLRTSLLRLIAPTKDAQEQLKALGVQVLDVQGNVRPEVFSELQVALSELNATARNQVLRKIFGQDAIRAAVIFGREGTKGLNDVRDATNQAGLAAELAGARTQGFAGSVEALRNSLSTLGVTVGQVTLGPLSFFTRETNKVVTRLNEATTAVQDLINIVTGIDLPPIQIDFQAGPIKIQAREDGFDVGNAFKEGFKRGLKGLQETAIQSLPGIRQARQADVLIGSIRGIRQESVNAEDDLRELFKAFEESSGGPTALNRLALGIQKMIASLEGGDEEAQRLAERLKSILENLIAVEALPPISIPILLEEPEFPELKAPVITFPERTIVDRAKQTFDKVGLESVAAVRSAFSPEAARAMIFAFFDNMVGAAKQKTPELRTAVALGFDVRLAVAEAQGASDAVLLSILRERQAKQQAFLDRQLARPQDKKQQDLTERAANQLADTTARIKAITDAQAAETKQAADDISDTLEKAAGDLIRSFSNQEQKLLNAETIAEQSESLVDDLKTDKALLALYNQQKKLGLKKIKDKEALREFLNTINQKLFDIGQEIIKDRNALQQSIRQQARENREKIATGLELDIEFAVITENRQREIALRRKLIKALEDQIKHEKGNTLKIKELRNEIARQKQAIKEAAGEVNERNNAFAQLSFQFLTTMQGFSANLLGNLLPSGAIGGTVAGKLAAGGGGFGGAGGSGSTTGGGSRALPGAAGFGGGLGGALLREQLGLSTDGGRGSVAQSTQAGAVASDAGVIAGPTRGQASTEIELLRQILAVLRHQNAATKHPSSKKNQRTGSAANDVM